MIFMCIYQVDRDKQADTQAFFANITDEQIAGEYPEGVKPIGRWHGNLNPVIGKEMPLAQAVDAHHAVLQPGAYGKIVLIP